VQVGIGVSRTIVNKIEIIFITIINNSKKKEEEEHHLGRTDGEDVESLTQLFQLLDRPLDVVPGRVAA
jgi:hypothetical protein